jgi:hypothetical protein
METNWAADHLQVIRTLMERSAVYRRALAPIMMFNGGMGLCAALVGWATEIYAPRPFILYWAGVAALAMAGSFLLVRRQALKEGEPFWSPPTRRVTLATLPALVAGGIISLLLYLELGKVGQPLGSVIGTLWLPECWIVLYGCAFHAAGFFMPRGMRLFGWFFVLAGCGVLALGIPSDQTRRGPYAHAIMGVFFGVMHLAYGVYLYFTEPHRNEA